MSHHEYGRADISAFDRGTDIFRSDLHGGYNPHRFPIEFRSLHNLGSDGEPYVSVCFLPETNSKFSNVNLAAGGGAYYFAKRSINADKRARHEADLERRRMIQSLDYDTKPPASKKHRGKSDHAGSPSTEASHDPAPISHESDSGIPKGSEKSKYEASIPYRAKKGDRFS